MFFKLRNQLVRYVFDITIVGILNVPPAEATDRPVIVLSMVSHRDLRMYLVAIKSFMLQFGAARIAVLDDGTLTREDQTLLRAQVIGIEIIDIDQVPRGTLPLGGTWERLACMIDLCRRNYVIQLDSDTLATGPLDFVRRCVFEKRSFILGTNSGMDFCPVRNASAWAEAQHHEEHVQIKAEQAFVRLPEADRLRYVRGSSGFFGLAPGAVSLETAEVFFEQMIAFCGAKFLEWGSEQVAANFLVANCPEASVLPHPLYTCFNPEAYPEESAFLHFVGTHRFHGGEYAARAREAIGVLSASHAAIPAAGAGVTA